MVTAPYPYCLHCKTRQAVGGLGYDVAPNQPPLGKPYAQRQCCGGPLESLEWMLKTHSAPSVRRRRRRGRACRCCWAAGRAVGQRSRP